MLYYSKKECAICHINPGFLHSPSNKAFDETARSKHTISLHSFGKQTKSDKGSDPKRVIFNPDPPQIQSTSRRLTLPTILTVNKFARLFKTSTLPPLPRVLEQYQLQNRTLFWRSVAKASCISNRKVGSTESDTASI